MSSGNSIEEISSLITQSMLPVSIFFDPCLMLIGSSSRLAVVYASLKVMQNVIVNSCGAASSS